MFLDPKWRHGPPSLDLSFDFERFGAMPKNHNFLDALPMDQQIEQMEPWSAKGSQKRSWLEPGGRTGRRGGPSTRV